MITTASEALQALRKGPVPPIILVGGDNEYLADQAFGEIRRFLAEDPRRALEQFGESADLGPVLDSFRTHSLFGGDRVLVLPEVNAFVSRKELQTLLEKALGDWSTAKTDRKRASSLAKLLHVLGLAAIDLEQSDAEIGSILGVRKVEGALSDMLATARASGKKATRGEDDAALLLDAAVHGGAPGTVLLMKTGEVPRESATVAAMDRAGLVVICNLTREGFDGALREGIASVQEESGVKFEPAAIAELRARLGIERMLGDKFAKEVPDLRLVLNEADRLATFVGRGNKVTAAVVQQQVGEVGGGARWELVSLFAEGKTLEAISKLRELVAQAMREDRSAEEIHYGRMLFAFADEVRQLIGIHSWARQHGVDLRRGMPYNRFKDTVADALGEYLKANQLVRQKPHPFALHKRFEAARMHVEARLIAALDQLAEIEFLRKCGGVPADIAIESFVLSQGTGRSSRA